MGYSTPYIILNVILLVLSVLSFTLKTKLSHKILACISMIVFVVFFCFRGYVQTDTINYYELFEGLPSEFNGIPQDPHFDTGFLIYMSIFKLLGFNYNQFIIISSFIDLILLTVLFRQYFSYKYYALYFYLFIIFTGLEYEFNLMRNIKSVLLFFISIKYVYSREFLKFLVLNLIGISFHWSSIIFIPLYFFIHKELSLKSSCLIFVIGILIFLIMPYLLTSILQIISENFSDYKVADKIDTYITIDKFAEGKSFSLMDISSMIWYALVIITYNQIKKTSSQTICFINLFIIYFLISCMSSGMILFRQRVAILFEPACWLLFIWLLKSQDYRNKVFLYSIIALYGMMLTFRRTNADILYRYDNFIFTEEVTSMKERAEIFRKIKLEKENNKELLH